MLLYVESIPLYVESMPLYFDRKILYFATMLGQRKGGHWCPLYKFKPPRCWGYHLRLLLPLTFHSMPSIEVDESPVHHSAPRHCHAASTGRLQNPQCGTTNKSMQGDQIHWICTSSGTTSKTKCWQKDHQSKTNVVEWSRESQLRAVEKTGASWFHLKVSGPERILYQSPRLSLPQKRRTELLGNARG